MYRDSTNREHNLFCLIQLWTLQVPSCHKDRHVIVSLTLAGATIADEFSSKFCATSFKDDVDINNVCLKFFIQRNHKWLCSHLLLLTVQIGSLKWGIELYLPVEALKTTYAGAVCCWICNMCSLKPRMDLE